MLSSSQIRAARAFLGISQAELAESSDISARTIAKIEIDEKAAENADQKTIRKLKTAFENKGIKFTVSEEKDGTAVFGIKFYQGKED